MYGLGFILFWLKCSVNIPGLKLKYKILNNPEVDITMAPSYAIREDCGHHIEAAVWVEVEEERDGNRSFLD